MGSSVVVSRNLDHNLIKPLLSRHAYACASRSYSDYINNHVVAASLSDRERKEERQGDNGFHFLVQRDCPNRYFSLLSSKNNWAAPVPEFRSRDFSVWPHFRGVCDGVLHFSGVHDHDDVKDLLWIPSTNQFKVIPTSSLTRLPDAFSIRFHSSGFGFDSKSQDYKVVRFATHRFGDPDDYYSQLPIQQGGPWHARVYVSGRYYWRYDIAAHYVSIISFDFATEKFSRINLPPQVETKWELLGGMCRCMLVEADGKLGMVICFRFPGTCKSVLELWVLEKEEVRNSRGIVIHKAVWSRGFVVRDLVKVNCPLLYSTKRVCCFLEQMMVS